MNEKSKMIIGIVLIVLVIFFVTKIFRNKNASEEYEVLNIDSQYNNETGEYYLVDETTGEVTHTAESEGELYIYKIDPEYNPKAGGEDWDNSYNIDLETIEEVIN